MKNKIVLKPWVKATLLLLPEMIIICQLFFVGSKLAQIEEKECTPIIVIEMGCTNG